MKGTLHKTEQGWVVRYTQGDIRDPLPELPLHPEFQTILPLDLELEGKEVEFDWCVIVEHYTGKGVQYAKLIDKNRPPRLMYKRLIMTAAEYLKENSDWFDKSPGGENLYFESEVIKMMEKYSSQQEISDEEIEKEAKNHHNYYEWSAGAKWYREQLKSR